MQEVPADVTCPHCGEPITVFVDLSVESQSYIEDCSVCCRPMNVSYQAADGELADIRVEAAD
jgi:transcription elongation factor Elf1